MYSLTYLLKTSLSDAVCESVHMRVFGSVVIRRCILLIMKRGRRMSLTENGTSYVLYRNSVLSCFKKDSRKIMKVASNCKYA
jgi:hypothetical protein